MQFSQAFGIENPEDEDWFDPILFMDNQLFVDPFLIFDDDTNIFPDAHKKILTFFERIFELLAESGGNKNSKQWLQSHSLLSLPEVGELCLGYSLDDVRGSGSGSGLATAMANGIWTAIEKGIKNIDHFESVQIFSEGIGPDRVSDATACILRSEFADYTAKVAKKYELQTKQITYPKAYWDADEGRWRARTFALPINPYSKKAIFLSPKRFLRALPTINSDDFWEFATVRFPDELREMFGDEILRKVNKSEIVKLATRHPDIAEKYVKEKEHTGSLPYDLETDPDGRFKPYAVAYGWAHENLTSDEAIETSDSFYAAIYGLVERFKNYVENQRGWEMLWNDNDRSPKKEYSFQSLFAAFIVEFCRINKIDLTKEGNIGRGPVDFKLSVGTKLRMLIEAKRASNSKFWDGLEKQLPLYMKAEGITHGVFLVAIQRESDFKKAFEFETQTKAASELNGISISTIGVDCTYGPSSASHL
jgi:hypothetical protein